MVTHCIQYASVWLRATIQTTPIFRTISGESSQPDYSGNRIPRVTKSYSSGHQAVGMSDETTVHWQIHECHHQAVQRCNLPVQQWAAGAVLLNFGLTEFHQVNARRVAILLTLTVQASLVQHGLPILHNAQHCKYGQ